MSFENQKCIDEWVLKTKSASMNEVWNPEVHPLTNEVWKPKVHSMNQVWGLKSPNVVWWLPSQSLKDFPAQMLPDGFPAKSLKDFPAQMLLGGFPAKV